jgi:hypothetical protein
MGSGKWEMENGNGKWRTCYFPSPIFHFPSAVFSGPLSLALPLAATLQVHEAEAADQKRRYCEKH